MGKGKLDRESENGKDKGNVVNMPAKRTAKKKVKPAAPSAEETAAAASHKGAKKALRQALKEEVKKKSKEIAQKLVDKARAGDMRGAEIMLSLMNENGGEAGETKKKKKKDGPSWAELLASEPEWDGEDDDGKKAG